MKKVILYNHLKTQIQVFEEAIYPAYRKSATVSHFLSWRHCAEMAKYLEVLGYGA